MITIDEFMKVELKVARVVEAKAHPNADKLLVLTVDTGTQQKEIVAGIARHYQPEDLTGRLIVVVDNLAPAVLRGVTSNGMLLASQDGESIVLVSPEKPVALGSTVR